MKLIDCKSMSDFRDALYGTLTTPIFWDEQTMDEPILCLVLVPREYIDRITKSVQKQYEVHKNGVRERKNFLFSTLDEEYAVWFVDNFNSKIK